MHNSITDYLKGSAYQLDTATQHKELFFSKGWINHSYTGLAEKVLCLGGDTKDEQLFFFLLLSPMNDELTNWYLLKKKKKVHEKKNVYMTTGGWQGASLGNSVT